MSQPRKFWMRWRVRAGYPVGIIYWLLAAPTPRSILIGGIVAACGLLIRGASSGHLRKDQALATTGPYARTRNPLYLGSAFLAAGFAVAGRSWWAGLLVAAYFAVFYYAVMHNEEEDLRKRFGAAFDEYAARVPLFFPRLAGKGGQAPSAAALPAREFSWAQYRRNREYQAFVGTIAGLGILWLRMWIHARLGH
jgi:hypothetical protein